jgi:transposase
MPPRRVLEAILYVLRTGIQWKALPKTYGAASSVHAYFSEWVEAGFFRRIWQEGLMSYDEVRGLGWEQQSVDGCMVKAPFWRERLWEATPRTGEKRDETEFGCRITRITHGRNAQRGERMS